VPVDVEFDEFVRVRSGPLLRLAFGLTRSHDLAEDLLQTALARCWGAWRRIEGDPEPYVRRALVNTYNSWWQRRWRGELPSADLPERPQPHPQARVDDRDEVIRLLGQLPRQQRTVLVLRYFEDMTVAIGPAGEKEATASEGQCDENAGDGGSSAFPPGTRELAGGFVVRASFKVDGKPLMTRALPGAVTVWAAASEPVPFDLYPLPPRPSELQPLQREVNTFDLITTLDSDNGYAATVAMPARSIAFPAICVRSQTPGLFRVTANGKELSQWPTEIWNYDGKATCQAVPFMPGGQVTFRATAEHVSGDWIVVITNGMAIA
jgi:RNA polymerase sigma-70 factor (sigma-E family)